MLPDGMAGLYAVLAAPTAMGIHRMLDAAARTARTAGDPRTLDQLRADGFADLLLHTTCTTDRETGTTTTGGRSGATDGSGTTTGAAALADATGTPAADAATHDAEGTAADGAADDAADRGADGVVSVSGHGPGCVRHHRPGALLRVTVPLSTLMGMDDGPADLAGYGPIDAVTARALGRVS